jgi:hypothetical protein
VIDVNPPVLAGDRAFDLATLLLYLYDHDGIRALLRARLLDLAGPQAACAYLAHMVLRQVDWSLRFHPAAAATWRHLHLARLVTARHRPRHGTLNLAARKAACRRVRPVPGGSGTLARLLYGSDQEI